MSEAYRTELAVFFRRFISAYYGDSGTKVQTAFVVEQFNFFKRVVLDGWAPSALTADATILAAERWARERHDRVNNLVHGPAVAIFRR